jgi:predicted RNase H-like HicB family nuclease
MIIRWSEEDQVYIAMLPEFDNAKTHGSTYEAAAKMGRELIESFIMWYEQDCKPLPVPLQFVYPGDISIDAMEARLETVG